jgi:hypothetical protein
MRARCNNPKVKSYPRYGGRGIKDRYPSFEAFRADLGEKPSGATLHRLDNDGDYAPGNCVWLARLEHIRLHAKQRHKQGGKRRSRQALTEAEIREFERLRREAGSNR